MGGYFKLYRELFKKPIWLNSSNEQRVILITLLAMANWKETEWDYFGEKIILKPGQFVTSLQKIVEQCKAEGVEANKQITVQNVRTMLQKCERLNFLTVRLTGKSTKSGRLITIVNWRVYQGEEPTVNKEINKEPNSQLTNNQQRANKEPNSQLTNNQQRANKEPNKHIKEEYKELEEDKESIRNGEEKNAPNIPQKNSSELAKGAQYFSAKIMPILNRNQAEQINDLVAEYGADSFILACDRAVVDKNRSITHIANLLEKARRSRNSGQSVNVESILDELIERAGQS